MSVTVRFKDDEKCPCPIIKQDESEQAAWRLVRGQSVRIGKVVPRELVHHSIRCDSDTFWQVEEESLILATAVILAEDPRDPVIACRHLLEIGD